MGTYIAGVSPLEANLMRRVQADEQGAFNELYDQFRSRIYRTALKILKEEESAEDALQETLLNVYRAARRFRGDSRMGTWINRITVNVCLEMIRRNRKHRDRTEEDVSENRFLTDSQAHSPDEQLRRRQVQEKLRRALSRIGPKHRAVVELHDLQEYTIREIAEKLSVAEGTIKSRLYYGREALRRELEAAGDVPEALFADPS